MKKAAFALALIALTFSTAFSQEATGRETAEPTDIDAPTRLNLAISSLDYLVTPGDVYRLEYRQAGGVQVAAESRCDGLYIVDLGIFGRIDAAGMTYMQLKKKIEEQIIKNYSYSMPAFTMTDPGVFRVCLRDGASRIRYRMAWGLSRLSEMVSNLDLSSFSLRNVELISANGKSRSYDLLLAALIKSDAIDPFVRPGDTVMLHVPQKTVRLEGEVFRPGLYEIKEGEGIKELIELFGGGLSNRGDPSRVRIDRRAADIERSDYVSLPAAYDKKIPLGDGDLVLVRSRDERLPLLWVEGAVSSGALERALDSLSGAGSADGSGDAAAVLPAGPETDSGRFSYPIREGQLLSDVLHDVKGAILPSADLRSASLFLPDSLTSKPVNVQALLTGADMSTDIALSSGYRLMIPSIRTDVMVSGAAASPGSFPYRSGAPAIYYISLAGGADSEKNSFDAFYLYGSEGKRKKASSGIQPGDRIHLRSNSFLYAVERGAPLVSSILGLAVSAYGVYLIVQQNVQR